jgi:hypothetical protein
MSAKATVSFAACSMLCLMGSAQAATVPRAEVPPMAPARPLVVLGFSRDARLRVPLLRQLERVARYRAEAMGTRSSEPALYPHLFAKSSALVEMAEEACLSELAQGLTEQLMKVADERAQAPGGQRSTMLRFVP